MDGYWNFTLPRGNRSGRTETLHQHYKWIKIFCGVCVSSHRAQQYLDYFRLVFSIILDNSDYSNVLTGGEYGLDGFAPQGPTQGLQFHRVLRGGAQLCQAVGSCLRV